MTKQPAIIESIAAFHTELTALIAAAERGNLDVRGGYDIQTTARLRYDVEVTAVIPNSK